MGNALTQALGLQDNALSGGSNQMSSPSNITPSATYNGSGNQPSATQTPASSSQGAQGMGAVNPVALQQAFALAQPTLNLNNKLVDEKNKIYKQSYMGNLSNEEIASLTPQTKLAIQSGNRNLMDMQVKAINEQLSGYQGGIANSLTGYLTAVKDYQTHYQSISDNVLGYSSTIDAGTMAAYIQGSGIDPSQFGINGTVSIPQDSLAAQNNNPGNLKFVGQDGATEGAGGFAAFSTPEAGYAALQQQIQLDSSRGMTVGQFINKYAPPSENNTALYIQQFAQSVGVSENTPLSQVDVNKASQFMANKESGSQIVYSYANQQNEGTSFQNPIDSSSPNYDTVQVREYGGLTQAGLDQAAQYYAITENMPSLGLGSSAATQAKRNAIINRSAQLTGGQSIAQNKANYEAQKSALKTQQGYATNVSAALQAADQGLQQLADTLSTNGININDSTLANTAVNDLTKNFGSSADIRSFQAGLQEVSNEYAQVFARTGQMTDARQQTANDILNGNITISALKAISDELQKQGQIVVGSRTGAVSNLNQSIGSIAGTGNTGANNIDSTVSSYLQQLQTPNSQTQTQSQSKGFWGTVGDFISGLF